MIILDDQGKEHVEGEIEEMQVFLDMLGFQRTPEVLGPDFRLYTQKYGEEGYEYALSFSHVLVLFPTMLSLIPFVRRLQEEERELSIV